MAVIIDREDFYKRIRKEKYRNLLVDISERIPTKDGVYEVYLYITNNLKGKFYAEYRIYRKASRIFEQDTKVIPILELKLNTDFKLYKYLNNELSKFYGF